MRLFNKIKKNIERKEMIPSVKEMESHKNKAEKILENMNLKEYISNDNDFIERFKVFCFEYRKTNPRGMYKLFIEQFPGEELKLDYELYNKKYFNFKRNIKKQIFERFFAFLNIKISNQKYLEGLKQADLEVEIWNVCVVHAEKPPKIEDINKDIFCTCLILWGENMKLGLRKLSLKKKVKAMTTGKAKRKLKKIFVPGYGKKGTGLFKNPKKAVYNKVYNKTTVGVGDLLKSQKNSRKRKSKSSASNSKDSSLIINIIVWLFVISFFIAILPFYLIYLFFKKK